MSDPAPLSFKIRGGGGTLGGGRIQGPGPATPPVYRPHTLSLLFTSPQANNNMINQRDYGVDINSVP